MTVQIIRPGVGGWADLDTLRRRRYVRVIQMPLGRALVVGRLAL